MTGAMNQTVFRTAIIGTGRIADLYDEEIVHHPAIELPLDNVHTNMYTVKPISHAGACRSHPGYTLVAAASRGRDRLEDFGRRHNVRALYTDYRQMLASEQPDVVSICTQTPQKCDAVLACAEAGVKVVIVEKALATSLAEADAMLAACERAGTVVAMHHPIRFSAMYRRVKQLVDEGELGELATISCYAPGRLIHNTHTFDLVRFLGGEVTSVMARVPGLRAAPASSEPFAEMYPDFDGDGMLTLASGATSFVSLSMARPAVDGLEVRGTEGCLTAPFWLVGRLALTRRRERSAADYGYYDTPGCRQVKPVSWDESLPAWTDSADADRASSIQLHLGELYAHLTTGAPLISTGRDGAAALEIGLAFCHTALSNAPVTLPLTERRLRVINR